MVNVTTWPPPSPAGESQQPLVSPNPKGPAPVKSLSSQVMKITEFPVQAWECIIALRVELRKASLVAIKPCTLPKLQGSLDGPARPCMSLHWSGLLHTSSSPLLLARALENWLKSTMFAIVAGLLCTSRYDTTG